MAKNPHRGIISDEAWAAAEAKRARPAQEQIDDLIRAGIIDKEGNVLIRMPIFEPGEKVEPVIEDLEYGKPFRK